jgi:iron complex outermembrane receptor protein
VRFVNVSRVVSRKDGDEICTTRLRITLYATSPALAQRVEDNAVADAEDAFGSNDGGEDLGV